MSNSHGRRDHPSPNMGARDTPSPLQHSLGLLLLLILDLGGHVLLVGDLRVDALLAGVHRLRNLLLQLLEVDLGEPAAFLARLGLIRDLDHDLLVRVLLDNGDLLGVDVDLADRAEQLVGEDRADDDQGHGRETGGELEQEAAAALHGKNPPPSSGPARDEAARPPTRDVESTRPAGRPRPRHYQHRPRPEVVPTGLFTMINNCRPYGASGGRPRSRDRSWRRSRGRGW